MGSENLPLGGCRSPSLTARPGDPPIDAMRRWPCAWILQGMEGCRNCAGGVKENLPKAPGDGSGATREARRLRNIAFPAEGPLARRVRRKGTKGLRGDGYWWAAGERAPEFQVGQDVLDELYSRRQLLVPVCA